jgi:hypothetical protein
MVKCYLSYAISTEGCTHRISLNGIYDRGSSESPFLVYLSVIRAIYTS